MVVSWLLNSMMPELSEAFLYVNSARELWDELTERFGESNGPLLYQLEKEITELYQGSDSVAVYYTKLKRLWDEISDASGIPICTCPETYPSIKKTIALEQRQKLMQFLMHLNEEYENIRGQILLLDPLPTVNKAYSMIQRAEKQRHVSNSIGMCREVVAAVNKTNVSCSGEIEAVNAFLTRNKNRKDLRKSRPNKFYDHCQKPGHERDQCFKLIGFPEWYDGSKGKKKVAGPRIAANVANYSCDQDNPLDEESYNKGGANKAHFDSDFMQALAQEVMNLTRGKQPTGGQHDEVYANFAGNAVFTGFTSICCAT